MPSYIELDKQASFPSSADAGKVIFGVDTQGQAILTDSNGNTFNYGTGYTSPYKVYTALITQSGGDNPDVVSFGSLIKGYSYTVDEYFTNTDFSNVGGGTYANPIYSFVATSNDTPNNYDGSTLSFNYGAPVVEVLENTLGNVWFEYVSTGTFYIKSDGLFLQYKTYITPQICGEDEYAPLIGVVKYDTDSQVFLFAMAPNGAFYDGPISPSFNLYSSIEIRVYN